MNRKLIGVFLVVLLTMLLIFPNISMADGGRYTIKSYDVNMKVNENNTYDITETINANFTANSHGIIRKIPIKNTVRRLNGIKTTNRAKITNISVNNQYTKSTSDGYLNLQIGDPDKTIEGEQTYIIKYTYDIGEDPLPKDDEFYFNILGTEWDTSIYNFSFTVNMPKEFDSSKLGFSSGTYGSIENENILYNIDGKTITGKYDGTIEAYNGITLRITLPEGYFVGAHSNNIDYYIIIGVSLGFVIIASILWLIFGKNKKVVETIEFYPPEGYNSAEIGFLYKGKADNKDVISLLIYLADKGYLKIEEITEKGKNSKSFKITKLKDYDGKDKNEKKFLNGLFGKKESVTSKDLKNKFYLTVNSIKDNLNKKENRYKIIDKKSVVIRNIFLPIMMLIIFLLITIKPLYDSGDNNMVVLSLVITGFLLFIIFILAYTKYNLPVKIIIFILIFLILINTIGSKIIPTIFEKAIPGITFIISILCMILLLIFRKIMIKRTTFGIEILGKIKGFKRFLKTAEKEQLEELVEKNPGYFYNILPYTYTLNVSDKWVKQFEGIAVGEPTWYDSDTNFNINSFDNFVNNTMYSINSSVTSAQASSSSGSSYGGSSSGGGFSGGGSGGGGGSSW